MNKISAKRETKKAKQIMNLKNTVTQLEKTQKTADWIK